MARTQQLVSTDQADATLSGLYMDVCKCTASVILRVCVYVGGWVDGRAEVSVCLCVSRCARTHVHVHVHGKSTNQQHSVMFP